jgi:Trypsin
MLSARGLLLLQSRLTIAVSFGGCTLLACAVIGCGDSGARSRPLEAVGRGSSAVTGGASAGEGDFPAVVAMGGCTATLVHPLLVVYAAHCGTATAAVRFGAHANLPERTVATERCRSFPSAHLGDGTDLAYCVLAEPVLDIEPERILAGCELDEFNVAELATVVGFGVDKEGGVFGEKRAAQLPISQIGEELVLAPGSADTCLGDSGGPVFVERREPSGGRQRRLVGVTSAGTEDTCGRGIGHYVNITRKIDWLEENSQLDLTPCFDRGQWLPTPDCIATRAALPVVPRSVVATDAGVAPPDAGAREAGDDVYADAGATRGYLASCGAAFEAKQDDEAPTLQWKSPKESQTKQAASEELGYAEFSLEVAAQDDGWGVKQVLLALLDDGAGSISTHRRSCSL